MRGHVARKGSLYYAVVSLTDVGTGQRKRQWSRGFQRKRDAEQALTRLLETPFDGASSARTRRTLLIRPASGPPDRTN